MKKTILILLASLVLISCGSKRKIVEETKSKKEITEVVDKKETTTEVKKSEETKVIKTDSIAEKEEKTITRSKTEEVDIVADSSGVVTREVVKTSDGYIERYTGVSSVSLRDKTIDEQKSLKETISVLKEENSRMFKADSLYRVETQKEITRLTEENESRTKDKEEKAGGFWWWLLFISLGLNVLLILYINRKRLRRLAPV
jgi:hypothetical protein